MKFLPHRCKIPENTSEEVAIEAAHRLVQALQNPVPQAPFSEDKNDTGRALKKLADIFLQTSQPAQSPAKKQPMITPKRNALPPRVIAPPPRVEIIPPRAAVISPRVQEKTTGKPFLRLTRNSPSPGEPHKIEESPREIRSRQREQRKIPSRGLSEITTALKQLHANRYGPHVIQPDGAQMGNMQCNLLQTTVRETIEKFTKTCEMNQMEMNAVPDEVTGQLLEYRHLIKGPDAHIWKRGFANDLGRLAQGVGTRMKSGTNTVFFVHPSKIPKDKKVTYAKLVADLRPLKKETHRVRVTLGGDKLPYEGPTATQSASLVLVKTHLNSVISTENAKYATLDISDYFYGTPMKTYEYVRIKLDIIPQEIVDQYNLLCLEKDGWVYMEVRKGMPGLKQAGRIAHDRLVKHMKQFGYAPCKHTPALWKHDTRPISFTLVVDDFGVKYINKQDLQHLIDTLRQQYTITVDRTGNNYLGLTLEWNYEQGYVDISIPDYILHALHEFQHILSKPTHSPAKFTAPIYGAKIQYAQEPNVEPTLPPHEIKRVQKIVGKLLYYGLAVDNTILVILGDLSMEQTKSTQKTLEAVTHLLNYVATHPNATVRFYRSKMILHVHSDGSYLSLPKAKSRAGGYFFLSSNSSDHATCPHNGPIYCLSKILKNVMGSAAEVEIGATYVCAQEALPIRQMLIDMGHPQPPTPVQVDNTTAVGFANKTIKQKRSKAIDMRFYWIQDRTEQGHFHIYWSPGAGNKGDYHTKHFPISHHKNVRPVYLHQSRD